MLKARWHGYEIDSSEAAYEVEVPNPERVGTLVRGLLTSDYFIRSYYLLFEEPFVRLRDFIREQNGDEDEQTAKVITYLDKQIAKFDPDSWKGSRIGVRAIEGILNYVGAHRQELLEAQTFRFDLNEEQEEILLDYGYEPFEPGSKVEEEMFYHEDTIPLDGVVLYLGCALVPAKKLPPEEQKKAYNLFKENLERFGLLDELQGWDTYMGHSRRDYVTESINKRHPLSLRVRLNPDASFLITGRWMDDGQFIYPLYDYLLERAARETGAKMDVYTIA